MYPSLRLPWSPNPSTSETAYRATSPFMVRTKGTIFLPPPPDAELRQAFNAPPRPQTRMSAGAVALTKHFERNPQPVRHPRMVEGQGHATNADGTGEDVSAVEGNEVSARKKAGDGYKSGKRAEGEKHPFWAVPTGSNEEKTRVAAETLERMLKEAKWRNVMLLHEGVAVYEIRMGRGWGMRWTLGLERDGEGEGAQGQEVGEEGDVEVQEGDMPGWNVAKVMFRGFLEPIAGLDHELEPEVYKEANDSTDERMSGGPG